MAFGGCVFGGMHLVDDGYAQNAQVGVIVGVLGLLPPAALWGWIRLWWGQWQAP
jgi:hypothetical protein